MSEPGTAIAATEPTTKRMRTMSGGQPIASAIPPQTPPKMRWRRERLKGALRHAICKEPTGVRPGLFHPRCAASRLLDVAETAKFF